MFGSRNVLRYIAGKKDITQSNACMNNNTDSTTTLKRRLQQNFLHGNESAFSDGDDVNKPINVLTGLIIDENNSYIDASFIFNIDPAIDDKVNDKIRDADIEKLCELNTVFFELPLHIIGDAVSIIDRFISKVKVKPKYMSCLTAACFQLAATNRGYDEIFLSLDNLANLLRCGASGQDLGQMQEIVQKKLQDCVPLVSIYDFIEEIDPVAAVDRRMDKILEAVLTRFLICWHRPSRVAIAALLIFYNQTRQYSNIELLYEMFKNDWDLIKYLGMRITEKYSAHSQAGSPSYCQAHLFWIISRKTLSKFHISCTPELETIVEEKDDC